jgi:crotonobetainyl-CoA:carnitine CoA-transferase CaiB-like acyl-CoA transferase
MAETGALAGLRVLTLTDESGRFAGKLLAEAGADVLRLRRGEPGPPLTGAAASRGGVLDWWFDGGTRFLPLDLDTAAGRCALSALAARADLVIETEPSGRLAALGLDHPQLAAANPRLVQVSLTPFGREGPRAAWAASDLVSAALGGVLSVTGDPDAPLNGWGRQTGNVGGLYAAICGLAGVPCRAASGRGMQIDLSLQEAVIAHGAGADVLVLPGAPATGRRRAAAGAALERRLRRDGLPRRPRDDHARERPTGAGRLAHGGGIDGFADLTTLQVPRPSPSIRLHGGSVAGRPARARSRSSTRASVAASPTARPGIAEAAASPQLAARNVFRTITGDGPPVAIPGPLVRLPLKPRHYRASLRSTRVPAPRRAARPRLHLGAGWPFATRLLAELGAEVIKIQTETRSQGANGNEHPYFLMWNRGKKSVALNMKHPRAAESAPPPGRTLGCADRELQRRRAGALGRGRRRPCLERAADSRACPAAAPAAWRDFVTYAPTIHALCGLTALTNRAGERDCGVGLPTTTTRAAGLPAHSPSSKRCTPASAPAAVGTSTSRKLEVGVALGLAFVEHLATGREPVAAGNRDPFDDVVPNEVYRCRDGDWLAITARDDSDWSRLTTAIADPALSDPRLATIEGRRARRALVDQRVAAWAAASTPSQRCDASRRPGAGRSRPDGPSSGGARRTACGPRLADRHRSSAARRAIQLDRFPPASTASHRRPRRPTALRRAHLLSMRTRSV